MTLLLTLVAASGFALAQQAAIHYVYDDLNRLVGVVDQQGNAASYVYDAVGNLLGIERVNRPSGTQSTLGITLVSPGRGVVGTEVQIFGYGFGSDAIVSFNGAAATVTSAAPNRLVTAVPSSAITGFITVTMPSGTAQSPKQFAVTGPIAITPVSAMVFVGATRQFEATADGVPTDDVRWLVNEITGGDATVGTISASGLYTAPATVPTPSWVTVTAVRNGDDTFSDSATVTISPPLPVYVSGAPVTVRVTPSSDGVIDKSVEGRVSVALAPVIVSVTPADTEAGTTASLVLAGSGFSDATEIVFLLANAADSSITVTAFTVSADGREATVDVTIAAGASLGARVVQLVTPGAASTRAGTGGNMFSLR